MFKEGSVEALMEVRISVNVGRDEMLTILAGELVSPFPRTNVFLLAVDIFPRRGRDEGELIRSHSGCWILVRSDHGSLSGGKAIRLALYI